MGYRIFYIYKGEVRALVYETAQQVTVSQNHLHLWDNDTAQGSPIAGFASGWWFRYEKMPTE